MDTTNEQQSNEPTLFDVNTVPTIETGTSEQPAEGSETSSNEQVPASLDEMSIEQIESLTPEQMEKSYLGITPAGDIPEPAQTTTDTKIKDTEDKSNTPSTTSNAPAVPKAVVSLNGVSAEMDVNEASEAIQNRKEDIALAEYVKSSGFSTEDLAVLKAMKSGDKVAIKSFIDKTGVDLIDLEKTEGKYIPVDEFQRNQESQKLHEIDR